MNCSIRVRYRQPAAVLQYRPGDENYRLYIIGEFPSLCLARRPITRRLFLIRRRDRLRAPFRRVYTRVGASGDFRFFFYRGSAP